MIPHIYTKKEEEMWCDANQEHGECVNVIQTKSCGLSVAPFRELSIKNVPCYCN